MIEAADEKAVKAGLSAWLGETASTKPVQEVIAEILEGELS